MSSLTLLLCYIVLIKVNLVQCLSRSTSSIKSIGSKSKPKIKNESWDHWQEKSTPSWLSSIIDRANRIQDVEDFNALQKLHGKGVFSEYGGRFIVMPLTDIFDPPASQFSHGRIQYGDKMCLPKSFIVDLLRKKYMPPWQFEITKVSLEIQDEKEEKMNIDDNEDTEGELSLEEFLDSQKQEKNQNETGEVEDESEGEENISEEEKQEIIKKKKEKAAEKEAKRREAEDEFKTTLLMKQFVQKKENLKSVCGSVLDFRSPENFIFIPDWMMKSLNLHPRDVVNVRRIPLPEGSLVRLQPHTSEFLKISDHQTVLENEIKHYSCLTAGTTIKFTHDGKNYYIDVVDTLTQGGPEEKSVPAVCVQDSDLRTEFLTPLDAIDKLKEARRKKKEEIEKKSKRKAAAEALKARKAKRTEANKITGKRR